MTRPEFPASVYLDSCCVLATINDESGAEVVERVLEGVRQGKIRLFASTMLLVEARGQGRNISGFDPTLEALVLDHITQPYWTLVELDRVTAVRARALALEHGLRNADAVHLASAIEAEAEVFMTLDEGFPMDREVDGIWISRPYPPDGDDIFTSHT